MHGVYKCNTPTNQDSYDIYYGSLEQAMCGFIIFKIISMAIDSVISHLDATRYKVLLR